MALVESLIKKGWLKTPRIIEAFKAVKREDFLSDKSLAELDEALPIGEGQTISQPSVVAFMLEKLNPMPGDKILDIGSGSGYTSALLCHIVGEKGKVISIEIIPELKEFGENNVKKCGFINSQFIISDGNLGYEKEAPYDKILASASGKALPFSWKKQLKIKGRIVAPVLNSIWVLEKIKEDDFKEEEFKGFVFVPLV